MDGPEALYADLTSGDPGQVSETVTDLRGTMNDVAAAIELISLASDTPDWSSPDGRTAYNMSAWTTRASAEVAHLRLNRAVLAVRAVKVHHQNFRQMCDERIQQWRAFKEQPGLDGFFFLLERAETMRDLDTLARTFGSKISAAGDFLASEEPSKEQEMALALGLAKSMHSDLEDPGPLGPIIPNTLFTGDEDGGWIPQGLGYDPRTQNLLQTTYNGGRSQLQLIDPETGTVRNNVELGEGFDENGDSLGQPDHAGGVSVHGDRVLVSSSAGDPPRLFEYSMKDIRSTPPGETVEPRGTPMPLPVSSGKADGTAFNTVDGDTLYVGSHNRGEPGELWAYERERGEWVAKPGYPVPIPEEAQGMTVRGDTIIFSTSYGRQNEGTLQSFDKDTLLGNTSGDVPEPLGEVSTPNMAEGMVATDDGLLTTFESGTSEYWDDNAISSPSQLWAALRMTVTPYSDLGIQGEIDVSLPSLERARGDFEDAKSSLDTCVGLIDAVSLPSGALGGVSEGPEFAALLTSHCDETSQWLDDGRISAGITADGLAETGRAYGEYEGIITSRFGTVLGLLS